VGHGRNIAGRRPLAITRRFELCDERCLVELRDGAEHLAHQDRGRRVLGEMIGRAGRHQGDAEALEVVVARELCPFGARAPLNCRSFQHLTDLDMRPPRRP